MALEANLKERLRNACAEPLITSAEAAAELILDGPVFRRSTRKLPGFAFSSSANKDTCIAYHPWFFNENFMSILGIFLLKIFFLYVIIIVLHSTF